MSPSLPERSLGSHGFQGSALGYGCMSLTDFFGPNIADNAEATLKHVLDSGVTVLNTSDLYGPYINEELVGRVIKHFPRKKVKISTKWGPMFKPDGTLFQDFSAPACRAACEGSLKRMGIDYIDLWVLRGPCRGEGVLEEAITAMKAMVEEGKVRTIGLSEVSPADVCKAHAIHPISALEMEWSLFTRDAEEELVPTARELGIGFLAYSPLGRGMLTGQLRDLQGIPDSDWRKSHNPRFQGEAFTKNLQLADNVEALAKKKGCTSGQLALAWVMAQGDNVIPIPGTKRASCVTENLGALDVHLTPEEMRELEDAVPHGEVMGDRYPNIKHTSFHYGTA